MHLDEEQIRRLVHGELAPPMEASARAHLTGCAGCRGRVAVARRAEDEVHALLRHLDHAPPRIDAHAVVARASAHRFGWTRWAAGIVLALGVAGAAYAAPGSPLPAWVQAVAQWMGGGPAQSPDPEGGVAGIAVAPGRELLILFTSFQTEGQAQVSLTDGVEVVVRASSGAAVFTSGVDRLVIDNGGSTATFGIEIPRAAPRVEIRVGDARVFLKEGSRVRGPYVIPLRP